MDFAVLPIQRYNSARDFIIGGFISQSTKTGKFENLPIFLSRCLSQYWRCSWFGLIWKTVSNQTELYIWFDLIKGTNFEPCSFFFTITEPYRTSSYGLTNRLTILHLAQVWMQSWLILMLPGLIGFPGLTLPCGKCETCPSHILPPLLKFLIYPPLFFVLYLCVPEVKVQVPGYKCQSTLIRYYI